MNAESESESSKTFAWGVTAGIAVLIGAGGLYLSGIFGSEPDQVAPQTENAVQTPAETTESAATEPVDETPDATAETEAAAVPPTLDQIFVEPDGNTVLSGNAEPGTEVHVLLDGENVHSFTVDPSGQFAEFVSIPFSDDARGLTLETQGDQPVRSDDYVIAALPAPEPADETVPAEDTTETAAADLQEDATETAAVDLQEDATETAAVDLQEDTTEGGAADPQEDTTETASADPQQDMTETAVADLQEDTTETANAAAETAEDQAEQTADAQTEDTQNQQVAILRSGEDGVEIVQSPTVQPKAPDQVALDTIGYSDTGEVELTGRVPDGSVVRLYLNNQLVDDLSPEEDGKWRSELEGVEPGVYTLRVDEVGTDGTVVSRLETPFKREPLEVLRAAEATDGSEIDPDTPPIRSVTVQEGDTLWAISRERFGEGILYVKLFEANRDSIRDPDLIYPGQIFNIPE